MKTTRMSASESDDLAALIGWLIDNLDELESATITVTLPPLGTIHREFGLNPTPKKAGKRRDVTWWWCDECALPATTGGPLAFHQQTTGHEGRTKATRQGSVRPVRSA